jgi:Tol biopolymer transport system component
LRSGVWVLTLGSAFAVSCSGTAGDLFAGGTDGTGPSTGDAMSGTAGAGTPPSGAAGGGGGGAAASVSGGGSASSGGAAPLGVGVNQGLGSGANGSSGAGGASSSGDGSDSGGRAGDAGSGPVDPMPAVCDPCPCSTGPFAEPELVAGLGTGLPNFGPAPSADGLTLFFSAIGTTEDIVFATRSTRANEFSSPLPIAAVNGADTEEGTPFISVDGRSLFFFSTRPDPDAPGDRDLWVATRPDGSAAFSEPSLVPDVNTLELEHLPRLTPDGLTLMFVSGRDSPNGASNIWQARRESLGQPFGVPVELPGVNSDARDEGFWLSADGLTVFFASNRLVQTDMDIWVASRPDVDSAFGDVQNLDVVNTSGLELDPALTLDGFELFFASDRSGTMQLYRSARQCE